jgi:hypothetical protein
VEIFQNHFNYPSMLPQNTQNFIQIFSKIVIEQYIRNNS